MAKAVILGNGRRWRTRKDAIEHFRNMLARYRDGERVDNQADHSDLCSLLARYDCAITDVAMRKAGFGVAHFSRELNEGEGGS